MDVTPGTLLAGVYEVRNLLGRGGMGAVYAAKHLRTGQLVAVKVLHHDAKGYADAVERFRREAKAASSVQSEHVTRVFDVEEGPKHGVVIVFELLKGKSLLEYLRSEGVLPIESAADIVRQILRGLIDAHAVGIIHRDLKPSNVFLEQKPEGLRVKLVDFGVSKLPRNLGGDTLTAPDQALGSFLFMPPEQTNRAANVDSRADIYALGIVVFQCLTGLLPFPGKGTVEVVNAKRKGDKRTMAQATGKPFRPDLEAWVSRCIEKEPDHRFSSAVEALEAWETMFATEQDPATLHYRSRRPVTVTAPMPLILPPGYSPLPGSTATPSTLPNQTPIQSAATEAAPSTPLVVSGFPAGVYPMPQQAAPQQANFPSPAGPIQAYPISGNQSQPQPINYSAPGSNQFGYGANGQSQPSSQKVNTAQTPIMQVPIPASASPVPGTVSPQHSPNNAAPPTGANGVHPYYQGANVPNHQYGPQVAYANQPYQNGAQQNQPYQSAAPSTPGYNSQQYPSPAYTGPQPTPMQPTQPAPTGYGVAPNSGIPTSSGPMSPSPLSPAPVSPNNNYPSVMPPSKPNGNQSTLPSAFKAPIVINAPAHPSMPPGPLPTWAIVVMSALGTVVVLGIVAVLVWWFALR